MIKIYLITNNYKIPFLNVDLLLLDFYYKLELTSTKLG